MSKPNNEVIVIEKQLSPLVESALKLKIASQSDMPKATEVLSQLNKFQDKITLEKERVIKPLNEALKSERSRWKPLEATYEKAISYIRTQMSAFQTAEIKRQREAEAKLAARVEKGTLRIETAVAKLDQIEKPEAKVVTDNGQVSFREDKILKIIDEKKIPREFLIPDEDRILETLKAGVTVAGCEVDIVMIPVNRR